MEEEGAEEQRATYQPSLLLCPPMTQAGGQVELSIHKNTASFPTLGVSDEKKQGMIRTR